MNDCKMRAKKAVDELGEQMGGYVPPTLHHIKNNHPALAVIIRDMDKVINTDGALDRKTKRLIALACVSVRMCEGCASIRRRRWPRTVALRERRSWRP